MNIYQQIEKRINVECILIDKVVDRALLAWAEAGKNPDVQSLYLDSVALNLHGFYTGIERLFELIARHIDESVPSDKNWHRSLLKQMTENYKNYRPAVISQSIFFELDEFRRFRHVVRNVYSTSLAPDRMKTIINNLPTTWKQLNDELHAFAEFLKHQSLTVNNDKQKF